MTRAKDISKIVTDANLSGTLDVTGTVTAGGIVKSGSTGSNGQFDLARTSDGLSVGKITMTESSQVMNYHNLLGSGIHSFTVNSTERMRIDSSGKVGLGIDPSTLPSFVSHAMKIANGGGLSITSPASGDNRYIFFGTGTSSSDVQLAAIKNSSSELMFLGASGAERMRIDSSGNLLVGTTGTLSMGSSTTAGFQVGGDFRGVRTDGNPIMYLKHQSNDGQFINFYKDTTSVGSIGNSGAQFVITTTGSNFYVNIPSGGDFRPFTDNAIDLGNGARRWDDVYATNGTIQTSDRNEKQDIAELSDAEARVAVVAKGLMRKFRWKSAVAEKGDDARTHFGIIAQDLQDAFTAESLDAGDYAMFISSTWWEKEISVDAVEADEANGIEAKDAYTYMDTKDEATEGYTEKTRLGVRYSELLAFIISAI